MRRLIVLLAGLGVLPAAAGCVHTAGYCDCVPAVNLCCLYGLYPPGLLEHATGVPTTAAHTAVNGHDVPANPERLAPPREGQ
jgi:hypothetical protein